MDSDVRRLLDIESIKQVKATFCYAVDDRDWRTIAGLFAKDGHADFGEFGVVHGQGEIGRFFQKLYDSVTSQQHMIHNPIVKVEGDRATGKWYFEIPASMEAGTRAVWIQGRYDDEFARVDGVWKFSRVACSFHYITPFDEGWVKTRFVSHIPAILQPEGERKG